MAYRWNDERRVAMAKLGFEVAKIVVGDSRRILFVGYRYVGKPSELAEGSSRRAACGPNNSKPLPGSRVDCRSGTVKRSTRG